jgi:hypothetical protein
MGYGDFNKTKEFAAGLARVLAASDRRAEADVVLGEFVTKMKGYKIPYEENTISQYKSAFCTVLKNNGVEKSDHPTLPPSYSTNKRQRDQASMALGQLEPICIKDYPDLMDCIRTGLRAGIDAKQAPQVQFFLGMWLPLRVNDNNEAHVRSNQTSCDVTTNCVVSGVTTSDGLDVVGTVVNRNPSKACHTTPPYATVFVCDSEDYPLAQEAMAFLHDPAITSLSCTTYVKDFKNKVPSGPEKKQEWGSHAKGIFKAMLEELDFCSHIIDYGRKKKGTVTRSMGRWLGASSIEQGRFKFPAPLTPSVALGAALGHASNSSSNPAYLCIHCADPPRVRGVSMRNAETSPLYLDNGATKITKGVYLVADPPTSED